MQNSSAQCIPKRTPGVLGRSDAADPDVGLCLAGDSQGPLGFGDDAAALAAMVDPYPPQSRQLVVLEVDLEAVEKFLFTVAHAEAMDHFASVEGWFDKEIQLGAADKTRARAGENAKRKMTAFLETLVQGPDAVEAFLRAEQQAKDRHRASLKRKFDQVRRGNESAVATLGGVIKGLAVVEFASTCFIKTASAITGTGTIIDIAYESSQAGIDEMYSQKNKGGKKPVQAVVVKATVETGKEMVELVNEMAADKLLNPKEAALAKDWFKGYRLQEERLRERVAWLERRLEEELSKRSRGAKLVRKYRKKLRTMPVKRSLVRKAALSAVSKKAAGQVFSIVFLADDLKEAWERLEGNLKAADY